MKFLNKRAVYKSRRKEKPWDKPRRCLYTCPDAIGINKHVADVLSGADFDGDFVMSLPLNKVTKISSDKPLDGLRDFEEEEEA